MSVKQLFFLVLVLVVVVAILRFDEIGYNGRSPELPSTKGETEVGSIETAGKIETVILPVGPRDDSIDRPKTDQVEIVSVYEAVFGRPAPGNPLTELHFKFKNESRDESWASAMESGIGQHIRKSGADTSATVEIIECRSSICEVLGIMPDASTNPGFRPSDLLADEFGLGWWQGYMSISTRKHTFEGEGITRFMLIIERKDEQNWGIP